MASGHRDQDFGPELNPSRSARSEYLSHPSYVWDHVIVFDPQPNTGPEISVGSVRVATFNILSPLLADWHRRKKVVAQHLRAADPDIIALQEIDAGADREEVVAELLGPGRHVAWHSRTTPEGVGSAVASR